MMLPMVPGRVEGTTRPSHPTALLLEQKPPLPLLSQPPLHKHLLQKLRQQLPASVAPRAMPRQEVLPNHRLLHQMLRLAQGQLFCMSSRSRPGKRVRAPLKLLQGWTRPLPSLLSQHSRLSSSNQKPQGLGPALWAVPVWHQGLFTAALLKRPRPQPPSRLLAHKLQLLSRLRSSSSSKGKQQLPGLHLLQAPPRAPHAREVLHLEGPGPCPTTALLSQVWCRTPPP